MHPYLNLYGCKQEVKSQAFTSLVRPHLEYSSSVWDPHFKQDILAVEKISEMVPNSLLETIHTKTVLHPYLTTYIGPHFNNGENRKATNILSPIIIPEYIKLSSVRTRTDDLAYVQLQTNYEQYKNSFLPRTIKEWNSLPPDLVHAASVDFTARLQSYTF